MRSDTAILNTPSAPVATSAPPVTRPVIERPLPLLTPAQWAVQVKRHLIDCRRQRSSLALVLVAVDRIRLVDAQGAPGAMADASLRDAVLDRAAQRLRSRVRSTDRVVLLGEHRVGVVLVGAGARQATEIDARLVSALAGTYRAGERVLVATSRSAVAAFPENATHTEALIHGLFAHLTMA